MKLGLWVISMVAAVALFAAVEIAGSQEQVRSEFTQAGILYYVEVLDDDAQQHAILSWVLTLPQHAVDRFENRFGPQDAAGVFTDAQRKGILNSQIKHRRQLMRNGYVRTHEDIVILDAAIAGLRDALNPVEDVE